MAACGSLQHIFETPLPEKNPTLLETLSSWNQMMPVNPPMTTTEHLSSFTEIFGELHFKESFVPPSPSPSPSLSSPPSSSFADSNQHPLGESSSYHGRSNSFSSTNSESLQLCTEGLGYESLDDVEDLKGGMMEYEEEWQREELEDQMGVKKQQILQCQNLKPGVIRRSRSANMADFPPPISCMGEKWDALGWFQVL